jgi:hypothetical protein
MVKMNSSTDLNEIHVSHVEHNHVREKEIYSVPLVRYTEKYFHFGFIK